jgi:hypothetical protein
MTPKRQHSPSGIPSRRDGPNQADARIEECRHCGGRIVWRRDSVDRRSFNEVAPRHRCPGRDKEDRDHQEERARDLKLDEAVRPIIAARLEAFLPTATKAVQTEPIVLYSGHTVVSAAEQDRRDREEEKRGRQFLIRQYLHHALKRIVEYVPSVTRDEILAYVETCLPIAGPGRPSAPFDPALVVQAYEKIQQDFPAMRSRDICQEIATRLSVSRRTIEVLRSRKS